MASRDVTSAAAPHPLRMTAMDRPTVPIESTDLDALLAGWNAATTRRWPRSTSRPTRLVRELRDPDHIKPRLLGHWGTSPALNPIYVQLNRLIRPRDRDVVV
jgi:xylulose-5-phosphate/fructose-6-phosphate phosphoketolase